ncbi:hypothetical protein [uncultured Proteiniphilum sp.]|uniref:hypothetical protein n=1 Tax=uncultured Proteiniphilum sp. TaxID=497637 RepID=UPI00262A4C2B|nr:hypothetical protein [uncultured Proteiniphilum sp.]
MCKRFLIQVPFPYAFLLSAMALLLGYVLLKIDIPVTWQSIAGAIVIQFFLCSRINYRADKRLFLRQYRDLYPLSVFIDSFFLSLPFVLVNGYLWMTAVIVAFLYSALDLSARRSVKLRPVLPSPFFMKSSYLWHAQQRYILPVIWILIALFIVIAYIHDNYNLGIVVLGGGTFIGFLATIMETEEADFVQMYINTKHFITRTLLETLYNTALYLFPLVAALFFLFPAERMVTLLFFPAVLLINVQLLWTKYAFYPSAPLATVIFFFGLLLQGALSITLYGIIIVPVYTVILYFLFIKNIRAIISVYEKRL